MSNNEQAIIYSEVYGILDMLGGEYIKLIPEKLYKHIEENKNKEYAPTYDINKPLEEQNIKKRTAAFICMLHYKYWCESDEEKKEIVDILNENYEKQKEKYFAYEKTIFKKENNLQKTSENSDNDLKMENKKESVALTVQEKKNWFTKFVSFIKKIFGKGKE